MDPLTGEESDLRHCPLSMPDESTWSLLELVRRWESGQIRIDYSQLCDMPSILLDASDFLRAAERQIQEEAK